MSDLVITKKLNDSATTDLILVDGEGKFKFKAEVMNEEYIHISIECEGRSVHLRTSINFDEDNHQIVLYEE